MLTTIVLLVVGCTIAVMFSQEFGKLFKKTLIIPGVKLLAPLILASFIIAYYENWVLWVLLQLKRVLYLITLGPYLHQGTFYSSIILLASLSLLPPLFIHLWIRRKRSHQPIQNLYLISSIIWLFVAILLTVNYSY